MNYVPHTLETLVLCKKIISGEFVGIGISWVY